MLTDSLAFLPSRGPLPLDVGGHLLTASTNRNVRSNATSLKRLIRQSHAASTSFS